MSNDVEKGKTIIETTEEKVTTRTSPIQPQTDHETTPKKKPLVLRIVRFLQDQWFLITLAILIAIASQHQVPLSHQKLKTTIVAYLCVSVIFFLTGCTLKTQVLIDNYARWKIHLFVQIQSFFVTSAIMFGVVAAAATKRDFMDPGLLVGMILTGCVATTISSNVVMTGQAKGNQALTVVESTIGNFLGPFLTPALFKGAFFALLRRGPVKRELISD
jgi:sodium/bile acid cotransporter 7